MKHTKKAVSLCLTAAMVLSASTTALACTGVYVGSEASTNGSSYMGRSEDIGDLYGKIFGTAAAQEIAAGSVYKDAYGFEMDYSKVGYPQKTYAYTYVKDSPAYGETMQDAAGNPIGEAYAEAGQNEKGVCISATVSTKYNEKAEAADPLVETGFCEISMASLILGGAATAKEGVDLMAAIVDEYGAGECNSIMISDPKETWYFEIVSGHQYAAVKMPADKVSVQPNIMLLGVIDVTDTENVVASENLVKLAEENGFLMTDENGNIDVARTYAQAQSGMGQYTRYWQGLFYVNEAAAEKLDETKINNHDNPVDLLIDPDKKMTTMEVLKFLATRGEGTKLDSNKDETIYAVGNNRQGECHIFETRQNMPADLATIQWQAMADAEFSIYIPYYSAMVTEVLDAYDCEAIADGAVTEELLAATEGSLNWNFQIINHLCYSNRALCGESVSKYFTAYQESIIEQQAAVDAEMLALYKKDPAQAKETATELGKDLAAQILEMTNGVKEELVAYLAEEQTEPFVPSAMKENVMPVYSIAHLQEAPAEESAPAEEPTVDQETEEKADALTKFADVSEKNWFAAAVSYVYEKGMMSGVAADKFAPNDATTRAMIWTILARMDGVDTSKGEKWYTAGMEWAMANGISDGTDPMKNITREQLAAMLYRFAQKQGVEAVNTAENLGQFSDAEAISGYAVNAMNWAVGEGILNGSTDGMIHAKGEATRAHAAQMLMKYMEKTEK